MSKSLSTFFGCGGTAALALALTACQQQASPGNEANGSEAVAGAQAAVANPCGTLVTKTSALPSEAGGDQVQVDCSAWQAFIALNWKADPANPGQPADVPWDGFGTPGDMSPTVWESYHEAATVFSGADMKGQWRAPRPAVKPLFRTSKFGSLDLTEIGQAGQGFHWLTSQRRELTYYEVTMNEEEFEFITQNNLTTAAGQAACAKQKGKQISDSGPPTPDTPWRGGFNMPAGFANGWDDTDCEGNVKFYAKKPLGAIELKAAWTVLPADGSLNYRYKTAIAEIRHPVTGVKRKVTVGLVGLHIIRKRWPRLPWIWATFEQIDNSPDDAPGNGFKPPVFPANPNQRPSPGWTYFNPRCDKAKDKYGCVNNQPPTQPCLLGSDPAKCQPFDAPMQITRVNPVAEPANSVTAYVWSQLPKPSVFNYYRLINVQWPTVGIGQAPKFDPPGPGLTVPLYMGKPTPAGAAGGFGAIVSNTTMESFQQRSNSCMDCHVYAQIASAPTAVGPGGRKRVKRGGTADQPAYASDYSFIFSSDTRR